MLGAIPAACSPSPPAWLSGRAGAVSRRPRGLQRRPTTGGRRRGPEGAPGLSRPPSSGAAAAAGFAPHGRSVGGSPSRGSHSVVETSYLLGWTLVVGVLRKGFMALAPRSTQVTRSLYFVVYSPLALLNLRMLSVPACLSLPRPGLGHPCCIFCP